MHIKIDFEDNLKSFRGPRLAHGLFDVVVYAMLYKKNIKSTGTKRSSKSVGEIEPWCEAKCSEMILVKLPVR